MLSYPARPFGTVKDICWACFKPVYESEPAVNHLGLWMHAPCYREENVSPTPEQCGPLAAVD
jgi:hypothetical protein